MSKGDKGEIRNMFNTDSFLITFVPKGEMWNFTDPSYNLPAFLNYGLYGVIQIKILGKDS